MKARKRIIAEAGFFWPCLVLFILLALPACPNRQTYPEAVRTGSEIVVDVNTLKADVPAFFSHEYRGKKINFIVLKTGNKVSSFLDACSTCYPAKKGYRFEDGRIICKDCNMGYSADEVEKGVGGCIPMRVAGRLDHGKYLIPVSAIEEAAGKF